MIIFGHFWDWRFWRQKFSPLAKFHQSELATLAFADGKLRIGVNTCCLFQCYGLKYKEFQFAIDTNVAYIICSAFRLETIITNHT